MSSVRVMVLIKDCMTGFWTRNLMADLVAVEGNSGEKLLVTRSKERGGNWGALSHISVSIRL